MDASERTYPWEKMIHLFSSPKVVFYTLPWLMLLLVTGTLAQRYIGLYEAERLFFTSFILWVGFIPLPGTYVTLGILSFSLFVKLVLKSPWKRKRAGIIICHMGALLLLFGGLLTAISSEEGYIAFAEGETNNTVSDYHQRHLTVFQNDAIIAVLPHQSLAAGEELSLPGVPFTLNITSYCRNCSMEMQRFVTPLHKGLAETLSLIPIPLAKEDEENLSGIMFEIRDGGEEANGIYLAFEPAPTVPEFSMDGHDYRITLRKQERPLPFKIRLEDFKKTTHPGTDIASEYESTVTLLDDGQEWKAAIRMNEPLRYKGYTLYQSSFIQGTDGKEYSILAVVKNMGRVFPYIASIVICMGLIIHLVVRDKKKKNKKGQKHA